MSDVSIVLNSSEKNSGIKSVLTCFRDRVAVAARDAFAIFGVIVLLNAILIGVSVKSGVSHDVAGQTSGQATQNQVLFSK